MTEELSPKRRLDLVRELLVNLYVDIERARGGFGWVAPENDPGVARMEKRISELEDEKEQLIKLVPGAS